MGCWWRQIVAAGNLSQAKSAPLPWERRWLARSRKAAPTGRSADHTLQRSVDRGWMAAVTAKQSSSANSCPRQPLSCAAATQTVSHHGFQPHPRKAKTFYRFVSRVAVGCGNTIKDFFSSCSRPTFRPLSEIGFIMVTLVHLNKWGRRRLRHDEMTNRIQLQSFSE